MDYVALRPRNVALQSRVDGVLCLYADDDSGGGKGGDFVISDDDEEGGPSASPAGESESEESLQDFIEKDTAEEAGTGPRCA